MAAGPITWTRPVPHLTLLYLLMSDTQQLISNFDISVCRGALGLVQECAPHFPNSLCFVFLEEKSLFLKDDGRGKTVAGAPRRAAGEANFHISLIFSLYYGDKLFQFVLIMTPPRYSIDGQHISTV